MLPQSGLELLPLGERAASHQMGSGVGSTRRLTHSACERIHSWGTAAS